MKRLMKAAVLIEPGKIVMENRPIPEPGDNDVLVKMKHVGICGSDVHYYQHGRIGDCVVRNPIVLGHESSGEVVKVGKNVTNVSVGDTVALEPGYTCGRCMFCKTGRYNLCPDVVFMATPPYDGAFAEYVVHPADMAFKLPKGMSTIEGALIEPLAVGFHAAKQANAQIGQSAAILGAGCIGLVTLMTVKAMGITDAYVTDIIPKRIEKAKQLGATGVFKADETDVVKAINEITGGEGVDIVFETAGSKMSIQQTVQLVKRGGTIVLVGLAPEATISYDFINLISKEASIHTVFRYRNVYPAAIKAVNEHLADLRSIVTNIFKFGEVEKAMKFSVENAREIVKCVIEFD
ncbi:MAG: NAD(P)-dependent alcohol dehydrogenase [Bacillota bacterium]